MLFRKIEKFFNAKIEKVFRKKNLPQEIQLDEIEECLFKEIELKKIKDSEKVYIPDKYMIILAEADYERLNSIATHELLYQFIYQMMINDDVYLKNNLAIQLTSDALKEKADITIQASYESLGDFCAHPINENSHEQMDVDHTIVFQKNFVQKDFIDYNKLTFAMLSVISGKDKNLTINFGKKRVHIGRRENNELVLRDKNCSRLHAYITFENYRHVIYDTNSLNGTYVNNNRIHRHQLRCGDKITIGSTIILYDIM